MSGQYTVHKCDHLGNQTWRYPGRLLARGAGWLRLEASFDRQSVDVGPLLLEPGDRFVETFYQDRWYNIFTVHQADSGQLKGWYCNIARPAVLLPGHIWQDDLALDLVVVPGEPPVTLDADEFERLALPAGQRRNACLAHERLLQLAIAGQPPFAPDGLARVLKRVV
ncbi:MAG TPA: DUF402 domain-containing protein [Anaerolineales bacterium]|jgi:hypothetical protein